VEAFVRGSRCVSRLAMAAAFSSASLFAQNTGTLATSTLAEATTGSAVNAYPVLEQYPSGRVLCIYAVMSAPGAREMKIVIRHSDDDGKSWSDAQTIFEHKGMLDADPNLVLDKDNMLAFSTTVPKPGVIERTMIFMRQSKDGVHWSDEVEISKPHRYICGKIHRGWRLPDGTLGMGYAWDMWAEQGMPARTEGEMNLKSGVLRSNDDGKTWQPGGDVTAEIKKSSPHAINGLAEPATIILADGRVMMLVRSGGDKLYQSWSSDGGVTWTTPQPSALTAHNSPAALTRLKSGSGIVAVWDNSPINRYPLAAALSSDGGAHWSTPKVVTESSTGLQASYPTVLQTHEGTILAAWQQALPNGEREIRLARFDRAWLQAQ